MKLSLFAWPVALAAGLASFHARAATPAPPIDADFYIAPASKPQGERGDLIAQRTTTVALGANSPAGVKAWNLLYQSTDSLGQPNVVSGTVLVPATPWASAGPRPVVSYAVGTQGLAPDCAPSRQLARGTEFEAYNIAQALKAGYAVVVTDYEGYIAGTRPTYFAARSQAQAALDIVTAATRIPLAGISQDAPVAVWGYSQGGQTAGWVAEIARSYAPEVKLAGVAAGGIPADLLGMAPALNRNIGFSFLAAALIGMENQYPTSLALDPLLNDEGKAAMNKLRSECMFSALFAFQNHDIAQYTQGHVPLEALLENPAIRQTFEAQDVGTAKAAVPLYQFHAQADEFVPLAQSLDLKKKYCAQGSTVTFDLYPGEHAVTYFHAAPTVLSWFKDRFAGKPAPNACLSAKPDPASTALPGGGDLAVPLKDWSLQASVHLKKLNTSVSLPANTTLTAKANVNQQLLTGQLSVPDSRQWISILGLPVQVGLKVTPAGDVAGTVALDGTAGLHLHGSVPVHITVSSLLGVSLGECKTESPVSFPLDFDGHFAALGAGDLVLKGTVSLPPFKGCAIAGVLTALMSGPGQTFSFKLLPPPPVRY